MLRLINFKVMFVLALFDFHTDSLKNSQTQDRTGELNNKHFFGFHFTFCGLLTFRF